MWRRPRYAALCEAARRLARASARLKRDRRLRQIERDLTDALGLAFIAQGRAFLGRFRQLAGLYPEQGTLREAGLPPWEPLFEEAAEATRRMFERPLDRAAYLALTEGAQAAARTASPALGFQPEFDLEHPAAVRFLETFGAERVTRVNEATKDVIRGILVESAREGRSYSETAERITERFGQFAVGKPQQHIDSRAHLVAVTETADAYCEGEMQLVRQLQEQHGLAYEKRWTTMGDDRVSDGCLENEQADWVASDEQFPSGDDRPPRFPGCRCDLEFRRVEQPAGEGPAVPAAEPPAGAGIPGEPTAPPAGAGPPGGPPKAPRNPDDLGRQIAAEVRDTFGQANVAEVPHTFYRSASVYAQDAKVPLADVPRVPGAAAYNRFTGRMVSVHYSPDTTRWIREGLVWLKDPNKDLSPDAWDRFILGVKTVFHENLHLVAKTAAFEANKALPGFSCSEEGLSELLARFMTTNWFRRHGIAPAGCSLPYLGWFEQQRLYVAYPAWVDTWRGLMQALPAGRPELAALMRIRVAAGAFDPGETMPHLYGGFAEAVCRELLPEAWVFGTGAGLPRNAFAAILDVRRDLAQQIQRCLAGTAGSAGVRAAVQFARAQIERILTGGM